MTLLAEVRAIIHEAIGRGYSGLPESDDLSQRLAALLAAPLAQDGDTARLDWLEANVCMIVRRFADGSEIDMTWEENGPDADTLRSTIDAARQQTGEGS